ncbi:MAG: hypothetical protein L0Y58_02480 [Verrucomicrobia subdivision 3 bacterium]|nr:hypothetical protein [Limisphaerales bacterium]
MQKKAKYAIVWCLAVAIASLCGCSDQKRLARRLSEADRVIVMDRHDSSFTMELTAEEAKKLVQAISMAREESPFTEATAPLRMEFFKGSNLIGGLNVARTGNPEIGMFGVDGVLYSDKTGTLETLGHKFSQEQAARKVTNRIGP